MSNTRWPQALFTVWKFSPLLSKNHCRRGVGVGPGGLRSPSASGSRLSGHHVRNGCRAKEVASTGHWALWGAISGYSRKLSRSIRLPSAASPRAWCIFVELGLDAESRLQRPMRISVRTGLRVGDLQEDRRPTICSRCPEDPERGCNIKEAIPVLAMSGRPRRGTIRRGRCRRAAAVLVRTLQVVVVVVVEMDVDGPTRRGPAIAVLCGIPGTARLMGGALEIEYCREVICGWSCEGGWARRHWCDTRQRVNRRGPTPGQFDVTGSGRV